MDFYTTGATVGIILACIAPVIFLVGVLAGVLIYHCVSKQQLQNTKHESSPSHQQQQSVTASTPPSPEYAEVIKLRQNRAYELTQTGIEMRANKAYQPMQHWSAATTYVTFKKFFLNFTVIVTKYTILLVFILSFYFFQKLTLQDSKMTTHLNGELNVHGLQLHIYSYIAHNFYF